jgi:murein DD-endopeptidase MepM/ murein hydrolase activator NlpD
MARNAAPAAALVALLAACAAVPEAPPSTPGQDIVLPLDSQIIEAVVPRNATLDGLLRQHNLDLELIQAAIESARDVFDPRDLRANRPYRLVRSLDGLLREFEYQIDADRFLRIVNPDRSQPAVLRAQVLSYDKEVTVAAIRGVIDTERNSLIAAVTEAGEDVNFAISLAALFSGQIDFQSELQPGDSFEVLFEKATIEGDFAGYGSILGARFSNDGRDYQAYRWVNPGTGKPGYYDEEGRSLKRTLLKSPLRFEPRITSGFSRRRLHPVHRRYRAHLGVDYAAPRGAPVVAVASGVVVSAGWAGGGGNQVRLRHASGLESYYLHLSSFAKGIRRGARVDQGQLIGRVGATGTATGPHLDYRLRKNGVFVDPRRQHARQPPGDPIPTNLLADYRVARDGVVGQLSTILLAHPDAVRANQ